MVAVVLVVTVAAWIIAGFDAVAPTFVDCGFHLVAVDMPGHGRSPGVARHAMYTAYGTTRRAGVTVFVDGTPSPSPLSIATSASAIDVFAACVHVPVHAVIR